jgi:hypothetical protein
VSLDLRAAYREHETETRTRLTRARPLGLRVRLPISDLIGEVNTYRMSDRKISSLALQDAEFVMNIAQHQHNEELARNARR